MSIIDLPDLSGPRPPRLPGAAERDPFAVRHALGATGLLTLDRLAELAALLPQDRVEHNVAAVPDLLPGGKAERRAEAPADIVRGIRTNGCWMVLKNIERDPEYAALLATCVGEVEARVSAPEGSSVLREGFVFLSSPGSVTPAHIDHEHNILLQVLGTKTMAIGRLPDDAALTAHVESLHAGGHRNTPVAPVDLQEFALGPGDGVYVPVHAPHLVRNGPEVSLSLSITWATARTRRSARVHALNAALRRTGLPLRPPGPLDGTSRAGSVRDEVKSTAWRAVQAGRRVRARG